MGSRQSPSQATTTCLWRVSDPDDVAAAALSSKMGGADAGGVVFAFSRASRHAIKERASSNAKVHSSFTLKVWGVGAPAGPRKYAPSSFSVAIIEVSFVTDNLPRALVETIQSFGFSK